MKPRAPELFRWAAKMTLVLTLAAVAILLINIVASIQVLRTPEHEVLQRVGQIVFVWLLPVIGAIVTLHILRESHHTERRSDSPFVESGTGDPGGDGH